MSLIRVYLLASDSSRQPIPADEIREASQQEAKGMDCSIDCRQTTEVKTKNFGIGPAVRLETLRSYWIFDFNNSAQAHQLLGNLRRNEVIKKYGLELGLC